MNNQRTQLHFLAFIFLMAINVNAQQQIKSIISWNKSSEISENSGTNQLFPLTFQGAQYTTDNYLPFYSGKINISQYSDVTFSISHINTEKINAREVGLFLEDIPSEIKVLSSVSQEKNNVEAYFSFIPLLRNANGEIEKIVDFAMTYIIMPKSQIKTRRNEFATSSVLADGDLYKFSVSKDGLVKISASELESFGINLSQINPKNIQIFGNPGGQNPEEIQSERFDDLIENSIFISGENDNSFDANDYIVFYAHGPNNWNFEDDFFKYTHNIYDDKNFYFLKIGSESGKRIVERSNVSSPDKIANTFDAYKVFETDGYNLLSDFESTQGTGQLWFSEKYSVERTQDFTSFFEDPALDISKNIKLKIQFAARSSKSSTLKINIDNTTSDLRFNGVSVTQIESNYADLEQKTIVQKVSSSRPIIAIDYPHTSSQSTGWLDYIQMNYSANLGFENEEIRFRNAESLNYTLFGFDISTTGQNELIWDISDPENIFQQEYIKENNAISFGFNSGELRDFVIFNSEEVSGKVTFENQVENQNLHSIQNTEMLIVYHPDFSSAAEKLYEHRSSISDLSVIMVPIKQIYNEFSSGKTDPSAIRNFARMLYTRDPDFNYLLLFGDGSVDYKHIRDNEYGNENFIPVYETKESLHPINGFPTDDYYALLDIQEGGNLIGGIDIAVGRLTVRTAEEADIVVDKLISYDIDDDSFGDWRLRIAFAGDDEDSNLHVRDADAIAEKVRKKENHFNAEKIYFDAFPQVSTPGGERYPQATEAINNNIFKGLLTLCYLGHGGPKGWAQERVLKLDDIENWDNRNRLPLVVTATCSFAGFDDPKITSAGELSLLKRNVGAIGLFTTVRAVFANQNKRLTEAVFDTIFTKVDGEYMHLGEVLRRAKNTNRADTLNVNARKFLLVGDPSMKLAIPHHNIAISSLNGNIIDENYLPDTIKALQKTTFEGYVSNSEGEIMSDFNGTVFCSVFDKVVEAKTLGNKTQSSPRSFKLQKTVLFKGQSNVENGRFKFEFYLPSDINFKFGPGKFSLYAKGNGTDAQGQFSNFIIGGSEDNNSDNEPPIVDVFLNSEDFVSGGISNADPLLLVKLKDDFGINVSGVSIGHDLVAELDGDSKQRYILNDFYESDLNNFQSGIVRFPLKDIPEGRHTINVIAWDISNNSGEGFTEFFVTNDLSQSLKHVLNYPNPFSTHTNFQFEHNLPNTELEIIIQIYNMSGQIVKTIEHNTFDGGFRVDDIQWDGRDEYGSYIANGVYLYKIKARASQLGISNESNFEKLVILK